MSSKNPIPNLGSSLAIEERRRGRVREGVAVCCSVVQGVAVSFISLCGVLCFVERYD